MGNAPLGGGGGASKAKGVNPGAVGGAAAAAAVITSRRTMTGVMGGDASGRWGTRIYSRLREAKQINSDSTFVCGPLPLPPINPHLRLTPLAASARPPSAAQRGISRWWGCPPRSPSSLPLLSPPRSPPRRAAPSRQPPAAARGGAAAPATQLRLPARAIAYCALDRVRILDFVVVVAPLFAVSRLSSGSVRSLCQQLRPLDRREDSASSSSASPVNTLCLLGVEVSSVAALDDGSSASSSVSGFPPPSVFAMCLLLFCSAANSPAPLPHLTPQAPPHRRPGSRRYSRRFASPATSPHPPPSRHHPDGPPATTTHTVVLWDQAPSVVAMANCHPAASRVLGLVNARVVLIVVRITVATGSDASATSSHCSAAAAPRQLELPHPC